MPLTPEQAAAFDELKRRGSLSPEQIDAFGELQRRSSSPYTKATGRPEPSGFSKSPEELQSEHETNVGGESAIYKPALGDVWTEGYKKGGAGMALAHTMGEMGQDWKEVLQKTPERLGGMIAGAPQMLWKAVTEPAQVGMQIPEMIRKGTEPLISPRTTGKALMEGAVDTALTGGVVKGVGAGAGAVKQIMREAPQRALRQGTNQVLAGLRPNPHTAKALENTQGDFHAYMTKTGRNITDSKSGATVFKDATDEFYSTNYQPLIKEIDGVPIEFNGQTTTPSNLLTRRAEINDTLGRIGYYDKNPLVQSYARSSPQVQGLLEEADAVRGALNKAVDTMTPTNAGAANILRKYADMKQVSDMARIRAERVGLTKKIKAGEAAPLGAQAVDLAKDAAVTLGTLGMNPKLINRWVQAVRSYSKKAPDPDVLFKRGAENWQRGSGAAAQPIPVKRVPIEFPKEPVGGNLPPGQEQMPFVPPGVGAMGGELPLEGTAPRAIQMPNELTQQFNRPPTADINRPTQTGQAQLPFVEPQVGGVPQQSFGFQGVDVNPLAGPARPTPGGLPQVILSTGERGVEETVRGAYSGVRMPDGTIRWEPTRTLQREPNAFAPQMTIGEAAATGGDISDAQAMYFHDLPGGAKFVENVERTTKYPLRRQP